VKRVRSYFILGLLFGSALVMPVAYGVTLTTVIAGEQRQAEHKLRDKYRHPLQTLTFFDVRKNMTVVEIWPGSGWYSEILAPFLKEQGVLYLAHFSPDSKVPYFQKSAQLFKAKIKADPLIYGAVHVTVLEPPEALQIAPKGTVDRVLTFRNIHNWMKSGQLRTVLAAIFEVLKPGGILGVVEHRETPGHILDSQAVTGYVSENYLTTMAEAAGFKFLASADINANPKDHHNHPAGVWTLPPRLKLLEQDREKYLSIGESDRMTITFIKP